MYLRENLNKKFAFLGEQIRNFYVYIFEDLKEVAKMKKLFLLTFILLLAFSFGCAKKSEAAYVVFKGERINLNTTEFAQKAD